MDGKGADMTTSNDGRLTGLGWHESVPPNGFQNRPSDAAGASNDNPLGLATPVGEIDEERRRISLGIKQCKSNPWAEFAATYNRNDKVSGQIKSITDFGIFIGLEGGIDGLVHLSDISWTDTGEEAVRSFKKGDEAEAVILSIDPERERISLGIKQLDTDPVSEFLAVNDKGSIVTGRVVEVDAKEAQVELATDVVAVLKASEISADRVEDARNALNEGDSVEARIIGVDRKNRQIALSIKAKDQDDTRQNLKKLREESTESGATTIGDLIKQQMGQD